MNKKRHRVWPRNSISVNDRSDTGARSKPVTSPRNRNIHIINLVTFYQTQNFYRYNLHSWLPRKHQDLPMVGCTAQSPLRWFNCIILHLSPRPFDNTRDLGRQIIRLPSRCCLRIYPYGNLRPTRPSKCPAIFVLADQRINLRLHARRTL